MNQNSFFNFSVISLLFFLNIAPVAHSQTRSKTAGGSMFTLQYRLDKVRGFVKVNGMTALVVDDTNSTSGIVRLNPFFKPGKNKIEVDLALVDKAENHKASIQIKSGTDRPIWESTSEPGKFPLKKEIIVDAPDFPKTPLWEVTLASADAGNEIVKALNQTREKMIQAIAKKDAKQLASLVFISNQTAAMSMGVTADIRKSEERLEKIFQDPKVVVESTSNALSLSDLKLQAIANSNLYQVTRTNASPVLLIKLKTQDGSMNFGANVPIVGKTKTGWEILLAN